MAVKNEWKSNGTDVEKLRIGLNKQAESWNRPDPMPYAERVEKYLKKAKQAKHEQKPKP